MQLDEAGQRASFGVRASELAAQLWGFLRAYESLISDPRSLICEMQTRGLQGPVTDTMHRQATAAR